MKTVGLGIVAYSKAPFFIFTHTVGSVLRLQKIISVSFSHSFDVALEVKTHGSNMVPCEDRLGRLNASL